MSNKTTLWAMRIGLAAVVVLGLATQLLTSPFGTIAAQEGDTATSTPPVLPAPDTVTVETCVEDDSGQLTCTESTEATGEIRPLRPVTEEERKDRGLGPRACFFDPLLGDYICNPEVAISGLVSELEVGESDTFTVTGSLLDRDHTYQLRVKRESGNTDIGFNSTCSYVQSTVTVPSATYANFSYSYDFTLHGCDTTGGTVTAELLRGGSVAATDTQTVTVKDPSVSITGLVTQMEDGQSDSFTVSASSLVSSNDYTIRVTTSNSDIGFNSSCSDRQEDATVTLGSTSYSGTFTLHGCDKLGGTVTVTLRRGTTTVDTDTQFVTVKEPSISITGLTSIEEGTSDSFTVSASSLASSNSYTIRVTTNNSDIGFNSSCSDRQEDVTVPSGRTWYSTTLTLYGCDTSGGTVTATLRRGSTTVDTDTQYVSVTTPPPDPEISITGLVTQMEEGQSDSFTVSASDLVSSNSYTIRVTTNNSDIGFNSSCSDRQEDVTVPSGRTSYSTTLTLYGCDTFGGTVTATLRRGSTTVDTDTQYVSVTAPPPDPEISITGLVTQMEEGQSDSFTVSASDLVSSNSYTIRVTTNNSDIGFNSSCSDRQEDVTVPSGRTSYSTTFTLEGCDTFGGTVTATLRRGSTTVDTDTQYVSVTAPPPDPEISITGLVTQMEEGQSDSFTVSASDLVSSNSYTIRVTTNNSDIGFNSSCSDRREDVTVPSGRTSYSTTFTLEGCDTSGGTVTATLRRGSTIVDTATQDVAVGSAPTIEITGLLTDIGDGQSDEFTVSALDLVSSNGYTIQVTTGNSDIGFNSNCSDTQEDVTITSGSTSYSGTFTLHGCDATSGATVTATLLLGGTTVDTATQVVTVASAPTIEISGLLTHIDEGRIDSFTVSASDLVASSSYTIRVTTDSSGIGFNNSCTDRQEDPPVATNSTSTRSTVLLHGCAITTGTVMAELHQVGTSGGALATAAVDVTVKLPSPMSFDSLLWPPAIVEDRSDGFSVLVSETVPSLTYRIVASIEPSMAAGFGDCSTNSKVSATFRGTRSEVARSFTLKGCSATTTLALVSQLQVQDGSAWSDLTKLRTNFSVLAAPTISVQHAFGDISEDSFTTRDIIVPMNEGASRLLLNVDESDNRAYVMQVWAVTSANTLRAANRITIYTDATYLKPPDYRYLGENQALWVAPDMAPAGGRQFVLEVVNPLIGSGRDLSSYKVTISEPNVAFVEQPTATTTASSIELPLKVRNSTSIEVSIRIRVECAVTRGGNSIRSGRNHGTFSVGATPTRESDVELGTICQGIVLQPGDEIGLTASITKGTVEQSISATSTVEWKQVTPPTLFHHQNANLMGGLQIVAGGGFCTLSFTLGLADSGVSYPAVSTTEHCAEASDVPWYQGPTPLSTAMQVATTTVVAIPTTCNMMQTATTTATQADCTIGDQSYGEASSPVALAHGYIFKPGSDPIPNDEALARPKIQYFTGDRSTNRFRIISARPPADGETVHKVGRTTGWTSGEVMAPMGLDVDVDDKDPTCPGGFVDIGFNTRDGGGYTECQSYTLMAVASGDSGSPVFSRMPGTDDVVLVGVLFAETEDRGIFIPIDRVYAEALKQGYGWSPSAPLSMQVIRPIPSPVGMEAKVVLSGGTSTLSIVATFEERDFGPSLYYRADLLRDGSTSPEATCYITTPERTQLGYPTYGSGANCTVSIGSSRHMGRPTLVVSFDGLARDLTGMFKVKLRACRETGPGTANCGGYGAYDLPLFELPAP